MSLTLQEIKRGCGLTNKDVAKALRCSASKAGTILQGRHIAVYSDEDIQQLANILEITFERCWYAMCASHNAWAGTPEKEHIRMSERWAEVQGQMGLPVEQPRELATVDGYIAIGSSIVQSA